MPTQVYEDIKVKGWHDLRDCLEDRVPTKEWLYRGQVCASWDLKTSLERHTPPGVGPGRAEYKLLSEFKRRAHTYLAQRLIPAEDNTGEWLALMQHFGAPTRLLDVTLSPYVATYFAVEDAVEKACAVWAVHRQWCYRAAGAAVLAAQPDERAKVKAEIARGGAPLKNAMPAFVQGMKSSFLRGDQWRHKEVAIVVPYMPERLSERLSIQQGQFLVPRDVSKPFMVNLQAMGEPKGHVVKIMIPSDPKTRGTIIERLREMNIQRASLFPGLEGFAQSFRTLLLNEPEEARALRQVLAGLKNAMSEE